MKKAIKRLALNKELVIVACVIMSFLATAAINKRDMVSVYLSKYIIIAATCVVLLIWIGYVLHENWQSFITSLRRVKECKWLLVSLGISTFFRIIQINDVPRWDAASYYRTLVDACSNFDFTLERFIIGFSSHRHPMIGYMSLLGIGVFLSNYRYIGVFFINLILHISSSICLYKILEYVLNGFKQSWICLCSVVLSVIPLLLGTFSYLNPDIATVFFFIFVVYFYIKEKYILLLFSLLLLAQSKEIGMVVFAAFVVGVSINRLLQKADSFGGRIRNVMYNPLILFSFTGLACFILYAVYTIQTGNGMWKHVDASLEHFSTFYVAPAYILHKFKQFFVLNFNWVAVILELICIGFIFFRRNQKKAGSRITPADRKKNEVIFGMAAVYISLICFYSVYITYTLPRYHVLIDFLTVFFMILLLSKCKMNNIVKQVLLESVIILFCIQAFVTIDPISAMAFKTYSTDGGRMIYHAYQNSGWVGDYVVYNHQFNYLDQLYDKILEKYYSGSEDIIVFEKINDSAIGGGVKYDDMYRWDTESGKRRPLSTGKAIKVINGYNLESETELTETALCIWTPYYENSYGLDKVNSINQLEKFYNIKSREHFFIPLLGGATVYLCEKK